MIGAIIAKKKIRSGFDDFGRHDIDAFLAAWADDATLIYPGDLSISGEIKGKEAIREWYQRYMDQFPLISFTVKKVCVENIFDFTGTNVLAVEWDAKLQNKDGEEFNDYSGVTVINLKSRKAVLVRDYISDIEAAKRAWGE